MENVKHLVSHNKGSTFKKIVNEFMKQDYITTLEPVIISPLNLGIPQNRERVFIPLIHKTIAGKNSFLKNVNLPNSKLKQYKDIIQNNVEEQYFFSSEKQKILKAWEEFVEYFRCKKLKFLSFDLMNFWIKNTKLNLKQ